ncbi:enhancer of mRNA-decapping protein 4-like [Actinidia eriantha]|uniref:enhancer of mRNA-decapping protein 4-like n=1 Tax=Actinidia eriantha TaxID=165200 RepID=UPI00258A9D0B|nr:enhancer of mRNA-decapping protein 4-like [Actinidia eriantha]
MEKVCTSRISGQVMKKLQRASLISKCQEECYICFVHLEYDPNPAATRMDYIAEFTVTVPILSFTGTSDYYLMANTLFRFIVSRSRLFISVHWIYPSACHHNVLLETSNSSVVRNATSTNGLASLDPSESKPTRTPLSI